MDYYRIPADFCANTAATADCESGEAGFFQFGESNICYGRCQSGTAVNVKDFARWDASKSIRYNGKSVQLPFDFAEVIENLRLERYRNKIAPEREVFASSEVVRKLYYLVREWLPVVVRRQMQKIYFSDWRQLPFPAWPVDFTVDNLHKEFLRLLIEASGMKKVPFIWFWPDGAPNCLIMTHDVETSAGRDFSSRLMDLDDAYGFKASFQAIPEKRYELPDDYVKEIRSRGFEFNIHDLNHDGHLYRQREEFLVRAARINDYVRRYDAKGFRSGAMYRNLEWYDAFEFSYDMSVPNVAHLEPMRGGCCTVMPFFVGHIVELPLTAAQDYSLFHILNDYSITLWKQQLALIGEGNGLMSFIAHPDYLIERRARKVYESLLDYLRQLVTRNRIWAALPGEVDTWWRARDRMTLVQKGNAWVVEGPGAERARVAYAAVEDGRLVYEISDPQNRDGERP